MGTEQEEQRARSIGRAGGGEQPGWNSREKEEFYLGQKEFSSPGLAFDFSNLRQNQPNQTASSGSGRGFFILWIVCYNIYEEIFELDTDKWYLKFPQVVALFLMTFISGFGLGYWVLMGILDIIYFVCSIVAHRFEYSPGFWWITGGTLIGISLLFLMNYFENNYNFLLSKISRFLFFILLSTYLYCGYNTYLQ